MNHIKERLHTEQSPYSKPHSALSQNYAKAKLRDSLLLNIVLYRHFRLRDTALPFQHFEVKHHESPFR
jgi:hypothetical protein